MDINEINEYADFWRFTIGVNCFPANGISKKPFWIDEKGQQYWIKWKEYQRNPISQSQHTAWKEAGAFKDGMAIVCGKIHHNESKKHLFLCFVDADNKMAIDNLSNKGIEEIAKKTLVEQHANPNKAHYYFYTTKPIPKKSSDATNLELLNKMQNNKVPAIEVKGDSTGIAYVTPSPHRDKSNYKILGTREPVILDEIGEIINKICDKYSLGRDNTNKVPMKLLMDPDTRILEGSNRHEAILRYCESILRKYPEMEENVFDEVIKAKNRLMCSPPLNETELKKQIHDAKTYIVQQIEKEVKLRNIEKNKFGTPEFWSYIQEFGEGKLRCLDCNVIVEPNPLERTHQGHRIELLG